MNGVVNLITREDFNGVETRASGSDAHDYNSYDLSRLVGKTWQGAMTDANPFFIAPPGTGATSETVDYNFGNLSGPPLPSQVNLTSLGVDLELQAELGDEWTAILNGTYGRGINYARTPAADAAALSAAGIANSPLTAFDAFGNRTSPTVLAQIRGGEDQYTGRQRAGCAFDPATGTSSPETASATTRTCRRM